MRGHAGATLASGILACVPAVPAARAARVHESQVLSYIESQARP